MPGSSRDNNPGELRVFLSIGSGFSPTYLAVTSVATPAEVVTADANLDGALDLVVLNLTPRELSVHLGRGDGTFADGARIAVGPGIQSLVATRLDGDAFPDLAMADRDARLIPILAGDGKGQFTPRPAISLELEPVSVTSGDLDGDSSQDLLVTTRNDDDPESTLHRASVYLGGGDGSFQLSSHWALDSTWSRVPSILDFDADGIVDVAYGSQGGHAIHLGRGDGTFRPEIRYHNAGTLGYSIASDLDLDGRVDLATAASLEDRLTVLYNQGPFPVRTVGIDIVPGSRSNPVNPSSGGATPVAILGSPEVAAQEIILATIRLAGAPVRTNPQDGSPHCRIQDVNGDGAPDLLCHVSAAEMNLPADAVEAELEAELPGGVRIRGQDIVRVVGPAGRR